MEQFERLVSLGVEKVAISSAAITDSPLIAAAAERVGRQSVVVVLDVRRNKKGLYEVFTHNGKRATGRQAAEFAAHAEQLGAGEIVVNSIDRDGAMKGYDVELIRAVREAVNVPITALGGAGSLDDLAELVRQFGTIGAAAGSLFVFKGTYRAVLINYPRPEQKLSIFCNEPRSR